MSKLQRDVSGQIIQFIPLPRIFQSLNTDLPSGEIKLPNGEVAHWRLHRNVSELKRQRKNVRELSVQLAQAFKTLVSSEGFRNHYGIAQIPSIPTEENLAGTFRNLLNVNTNRVEYSVIGNSNNKPLVETLVVPMGNLVFLNAYRGLKDIPRVAGLKGKMWLTESADDDQFFRFTIVSPVLKLPEHINKDRLAAELLAKISSTMRIMTHKPRIEFDEGQFDGYVPNALQALVGQHAAQQNGKQKKAKDVTAVKDTGALHSESFAELDHIEQAAYIDRIQKLAATNRPEDRSTLIAFLVSGIMKTAWEKFNQTANPHVTQSYFLALTVGIKDKQFKKLLGDSEATTIERIRAVAGTDYTVVPGDTLSAIALEAYGAAEYYYDIGVANQPVITNPDLIFPGQILKLPVLEVKLALTSTDDQAAPEYIAYTVQEGDTLFSISEAAYGKTGYEGEILHANKSVIVEADKLVPGTELKLPVLLTEDAPADVAVDTDPTDPVGTVDTGGDFEEVEDPIPASTAVASEVHVEEVAAKDGGLVTNGAEEEVGLTSIADVINHNGEAAAVEVADETVVDESVTKSVYLESAHGLHLTTFLQTFDPANFSEGIRADLVEGETELVSMEVEQVAGHWHRIVKSAALDAMIIKEKLEAPQPEGDTAVETIGDEQVQTAADAG